MVSPVKPWKKQSYDHPGGKNGRKSRNKLVKKQGLFFTVPDDSRPIHFD